jgi:hypothetical protein
VPMEWGVSHEVERGTPQSAPMFPSGRDQDVSVSPDADRSHRRGMALGQNALVARYGDQA